MATMLNAAKAPYGAEFLMCGGAREQEVAHRTPVMLGIAL
jgi:hypothetical protein